ncbi:MAG: tRNA lysidine(34) synthetase TilS [Alphaproteobacteria bacterium]
MDRLGPFEHEPKLAIAVSGGSDSLALAILAQAWAATGRGGVTALIVDHGLRSESAAEARRVAGWMRGRGIAARILTWTGPKPKSGIQEAARAARYGLLGDWCRSHSVFHLLVAHQREDQAETVWMRAARGSGIEGLAGMAAVVELQGFRLIRPLLGQGRDDLRAMLTEIGQPWIDDPSNVDLRFERPRLRAAWRAAAVPANGTSGNGTTAGGPMPGIDPILAHAAMAARSRRHREAAADALMGAAIGLHPEGYAEFSIEDLRRAPPEVASLALGRVIATIGGRVHPPRRDKIERLCQVLLGQVLPGQATGRGQTLAGCRIVIGPGAVALVMREQAAVVDRRSVTAGQTVLWDGRFLITLAAGRGHFELAPLGRDGLGNFARHLPVRLPAAVRVTLPALFDRFGLCEVPHLGWRRSAGRNRPSRVAEILFMPPRPLTSAGFNLA